MGMAMTVYQLMRERYNAHLVPLLTSRAIPGFLFDVRWQWAIPFDTKPEFTGEDGYAWEFADVDPDRFSSSLVDANVVQESVRDQRTLGGAIGLPQYGLTFGAAIATNYKLDLTITGIKGRVFDRAPAAIELVESLLALKSSKRAYWEWVNDDLLVTEAYYVTSFHAALRGTTSVTAQAAFAAAGQHVEPGVSYEWVSESELTVSGVPSVPLAVRGLRV
jgi:hypothetical protein